MIRRQRGAQGGSVKPAMAWPAVEIVAHHRMPGGGEMVRFINPKELD